MWDFSQPLKTIIQEIVWDLRTSLSDSGSALRSPRLFVSETNNSLVEVAAQTGFSDQAAFTRAFANVIGATPAKWRREQSPRRNLVEMPKLPFPQPLE